MPYTCAPLANAVRPQCHVFRSHRPVGLSDKHRHLLNKLSELIPDLNPEAPESLQRIFGLGLIALTMQITSKARAQDKEDLVEELGELAKEMVQAEQW